MIIIIMMINAIAHPVYKLDGKNKTRIILNNEKEEICLTIRNSLNQKFGISEADRVG